MNKFQAIALSFALAAAAPVHAALMSDSVPGNGTLVNNNSNGAGFSSVAVTAPSFSGRAGMYTGNFYPGAFAADSFFRFFCVEIAQTATGSATYTASIWDNEDMKRLFDVAFPNKSVGNFYDGAVTNFGAFTTAQQGAAFQLAVWELVFDGADKDLSGGAFHVTGSSPAAITALAQGWLDALGASTEWENWTLYRFTNASRQDYVSATFRVSEPAPLTLLALGLVYLVAARRRRP